MSNLDTQSYFNDCMAQAERIMNAAHELNGCDDRGTCVLGAGIEVNGTVRIRQVSQGNMSAHAAAKPAIEFLREQGINARWNDGRMD